MMARCQTFKYGSRKCQNIITVGFTPLQILGCIGEARGQKGENFFVGFILHGIIVPTIENVIRHSCTKLCYPTAKCVCKKQGY